MLQTDLTSEALAAVLANHGLSFSDLAKEAAALKQQVEEEPGVTVSDSQIRTTMVSSPDFVLERNGKITKKVLVFMPSCEGYFVKEINSKTGEIVSTKILTRELWAAFFSTLKDSYPMPEGFWTGDLTKSVTMYDELMKFLKVPEYMGMLKEKIPIELRDGDSNKKKGMAYKSIPVLFKRALNQCPECIPLLLRNVANLRFVQKKYGIDNAFDFLVEMQSSLAQMSDLESSYSRRHGWGYDEEEGTEDREVSFAGQYSSACIPDTQVPYSSFKQYVLYDAVSMGFADNMSGFFNMWEDCNRMDKDYYGKIKESRPENLLLYHNQMAYKCRQKRKEIDEERFAQRSKELSVCERTIGNYVFLVPKERDDFTSEAIQQSNCIAGYVDRFMNGTSKIFFMRDRKTPDKSLVSIEVCGKLVTQAKLAYNKPVDDEKKRIIERWCEEVGFRYES